MVSRTKYSADDKTVKAMFKKAGIDAITKITPLGAGEFNAVYEVTADKSYVLKIAPDSQTAVMTYEKDMIKSELYWYGVIRDNTDIKVPEIYYTDFSKELIPAGWFIMERLSGRPKNEISLDKDTNTKMTAQMLAQIHNIKNEKFGYVQNGLYDNWYEALTSFITNLLADAERAGKKSKNGCKLLEYAKKYRDILVSVPCCMVNYDLWDTNVICKADGENTVFQWIDPERSFWGDRIFDFICVENPIDLISKKTKSIKYYNEVSPCPIKPDRETEIRFAFAMGLLALIQETEKYYRYTPRHYGWWRNVSGQAVYYKRAFGVLKNG